MVNRKKRKIAVVTSTRADYGLLYWLMREIKDDPALVLQIIATGMHLSPEFGLTYKIIEQDGFDISAKVEMLTSSDTSIGIAKSIGLGVIGFAETFQQLSPDIIVILGDRFEILAAAQAALIKRIPLAHLHGGERSEGAIDDAIRHAITKMSHLHFVAAPSYAKRVIQLGENPHHVFNVGAPGLERIKKLNLLTKSKLEKKLNIKLGKKNFLITYHPETLEIKKNIKTLNAIFKTLNHFSNVKMIFTKANADESGRLINKKIDEYISYNKNACAFITLGDLNYLSILQFVDVVIGNSSSGIIEVPFFRKPTINIGSRQANRLRANSIIDCLGTFKSIYTAINQALSLEFKKRLNTTISPYTQNNTAKSIKNVLKKINTNQILIKNFNDLSYT